MGLTASSRAAAVGASATNKQLGSTASVLSRKMLVFATYDPLKTAVVDEVPVHVLSPEDAGSQFGFGFMAHRLVKQAMLGSNNSECWVCPQAEAAGAVAAAGTITFTGPATAAGTVYLYIAGIAVPVAVASGDTAEDIVDACVLAIAANRDLPVTAAKDLVIPAELDITSKSKGPWGNEISLTFNWGLGEALPLGVTAVVVAMAAGAGVPTIADALDGLGTGDDANQDHFTDVVHGYLQDSTTLDALSLYNGVGNEAVGLYSKTVARPFRSLTGDVDPGSAALTALLVVSGGRKTDRTSGVLPVPGSPNHPSEVAAVGLGICQRLHNNRAEETPIGQILPGIIPGLVADRWTKDYDSRDSAVKAGISVTTVSGGAVYMSNTISFFRPDTIPADSNGYSSLRNISIVQNMLYNVQVNFKQTKWQGVSIVSDVGKVTNIVDRQKARSLTSVRDDLIALAKSFRDHAWLYEVDSYTIPNIDVQVRSGSTGFDAILPVILSGECGIIDTAIEFDTAITVLLAA